VGGIDAPGRYVIDSIEWDPDPLTGGNHGLTQQVICSQV
jgi:hypothetical protein